MDGGDNNSFYTRLKSKKEEFKLNINGPLFCDILISERCNLRCRKCYFWKYGINNELEFDEYKKFIISLAGLVKIPFEINLGGGEPLLNNGILELIRLCSDQGLQPAISTNATLIDEEMAKKLSDSGLHRLGISLESLVEDTHDFITNTAGSHKRLMKGVEYLKKYWKKGDINIHTLILNQNLEQIKDLAEWVNEDVFFTGIAFQALAQPFRTDIIDSWYLDEEYGLLWPKDPGRVSSVIDMLIDYKRAGYRIINPIAQLNVYKKYYSDPESFVRAHKCNFGDYIFNVNVLGLVHLCCFMQPIGNIKKDNIKTIWYSDEAKQIRSAMHNCKKSCNNIVNCYFQDE